MTNPWSKFFLIASALGLIFIGLAGLVLPVIPGIILIISGAIIFDRVYPELKHHRFLSPQIKKIKKYFHKLGQK